MPVPADLIEKAAAAVRSAVVVCPHNDADGLASAAIALRARGEDAKAALMLPRGLNPFSVDFLPPSGVVAVLDQGVRPTAYDAVLVDHHVPESAPGKNQIVVSGHIEDHVSTSILMGRMFPDAANKWLAAVGVCGDYGDAGLKRPEVAGVVKSHVKKLVPLINSPRRGPDTEAVLVALQLLLDHDSPKAALADERIEILEESRRYWRSAYDAAVRTAPKIAGDVALIRFKSDCQIHPLIAQAWMTRLAGKVVIAANEDYVPHFVNFACRGGGPNADLRKRLRDALPGAQGEFAHGHAQATGGSLPKAEFEKLIVALGF